MGFGGCTGAVERHSSLIAESRARRAAELSVKQQKTMRSKPARAACATVLTAIAAARSAGIRRRPWRSPEKRANARRFPARFRASGDSRRRGKRPRHRGAAPPDRPGDMNDVTRAQAITGYDFRIALRAAAESTAFGEKAGSGGAMDRAVHAAAAGKRRIGGAHNGVDVNPRDVLLGRVDSFDPEPCSCNA
jgi:hypothetical protein